MVDKFANNQSSLDSTGEYHFAITPNDGADLAITPRAIYCGVAGNLVLRDKLGTDCTYAVSAGQYVMFRAARVLSTGTTATGLIGIY